MNPLFAIVSLVSLAVMASSAGAEEARTALVMGAWQYGGGRFIALPGIANDTNQIAATLKTLGFDVIRSDNPDLAEAERRIDEFGAKLTARKGVGLFYFSGHGAEYQGSNYLIPVGIATLTDKADLKIKTINAQLVLNRMSGAQARINLVFLDCCRNEPTMAITNTGLAPMSAKGVFVGFATASGETAAATANGSFYTRALLDHMTTPGVEIKAMHTLVTRDVILATRAAGDEQSPFESASLTGSFYFREGPSPVGEELPAKIRERLESRATTLTEDQIRKIIRDERDRPGPGPASVITDPPPSRDPAPWLFADSSSRYLSDNELSGLAKEELWRARNEIYARHGYVFTTPKGRTFAGTLGRFYQGTTASETAVERAFNKYEKANVERIKKHEQ